MRVDGCTCAVPVHDHSRGLVDYEMPVGTTGIIFVAALEARLTPLGPQFFPASTQAAYRRAASTLAHMALVSGQTFEFLRTSALMTVAETAQFVGVSVQTVNDWEAGLTPVPTNLWYELADKVCALDGRVFTSYPTLTEVDLRPRRIRVFPDVPRVSHNVVSPPCPVCC